METQTSTNGSTPPTETTTQTKPSPLVAIRAEFEAAGGKVDAKSAVKARDEYLKATATVNEALAKVNAAKTAQETAARALMVLTGAQPLKFGGTLYNPTSRGETVFYRPAGSKDVLEIK